MLALIFHLVDCATAQGEIGRNLPIRRDQLERAIRFSEYLETHAERVYSSGTLGTVEAARLIHERITRAVCGTDSPRGTSTARNGRD